MVYVSPSLLKNQMVPFYLKCVFCRQRIVVYFFFTYSDSFCFLISWFRLFTSKALIDIAGFICTIFVTVFSLLPFFFVPIFVFHSLLPFLLLIHHFIWLYYFIFSPVFKSISYTTYFKKWFPGWSSGSHL